MPRSFSIDIQSEVTPRRPALPCTAPAVLIAAACNASASVSVDLPASGWLITANVRRRAASSRTARFARGPLLNFCHRHGGSTPYSARSSQIPNMGKPRSILPNGCVVPRPAQHDPLEREDRREDEPARKASEGGLSNTSAYPRASNRGPWSPPGH